MTEVYSSFEGRLGVDCREGYIIYDCLDYWEIQTLSVYADATEYRYRVSKKYLSESDFGNLEKLGEIQAGIMDGCYEDENMQVFYNSRWYPSKFIREIQTKHQND